MTPQLRAHGERLVRYVLTGGAAAVIDLGAYVLTEPFMAVVVAATLSFLVSNVANYLLSARFAFGTAPSLRRYPLFLAGAGVGLVVNVAVTTLASLVIGLEPAPAKLVGIGVAFAANFAVNTLVVFPSLNGRKPS